MPLAIELASSWLRALPVHEIAGELETGLDLLESSARDVRERQRGVRVVFDHSWSLLSEGERRVLRRLSVFRGGFTRNAASEIVGVTLPGLASLVDKSFLRMSPEGRYDRHPLLSQYTSEKLAVHPKERAEVEQKHGTHYLGLVRELEPDLWTLNRKDTVRVFQEELANIRAAWDWAIENLVVEEIEQTTPAMFDLLELRSFEGFESFGTPFDFFGSVAEHLDESDPNHAGALGSILIHQALPMGGFNRQPYSSMWRSLAERGILLLESLGEPRALARGFETLGWSLEQQNESAQAYDWAQKALAVARKHGGSNDIARALSRLNGVRWSMKREGTLSVTQLAQFIQESLNELRALNHLPGVAEFLLESGAVLESQQHFEEAKNHYREAIRLADELGHHEVVVRTFAYHSEMSFELGEFDQAAALAEEASRRAEETGLTGWMYWSMARLGRAATAQGDFERARELLVPSMKNALAYDTLLIFFVPYSLNGTRLPHPDQGSPQRTPRTRKETPPQHHRQPHPHAETFKARRSEKR